MGTTVPPATFEQRLGASLIDFAVVASFIFLTGWLCSLSKAVAVMLVPVLSLFAFAYPLVTHATHGQTVGKKMMKIQVVTIQGAPIGWSESWRRSSVDGMLQSLWGIGLLIAIIQTQNTAFAGQGWTSLYALLVPNLPKYFQFIATAGTVWTFSELATMFLNSKRRALHDLLGATQVVCTNA